MSDPSTREQIRAEAIERIARAEYTSWLERVRVKAAEWGEECKHLPWDEQPDSGEWGRDYWRRIHAGMVDALGDLLPTAMEGRFIGRGMLRRTRYVTDWREPQEVDRA